MSAAIIYGFSTANAEIITFDFDSSLAGAITGSGLSTGSLSFTHGTNSEANVSRNAERGHFSEDSNGDNLFFISARSSDNKGTAEANLVPNTASFASFVVTPDSGRALDFSISNLAFDAALYRDVTASFSMGYRVFADTGSGFTALAPLQTLTASSTTTVAGNNMFETDGVTTLDPGWNLTAGTVNTTVGNIDFDISSLGLLAANQSVTFAVSLSGTRDNHFSFGSSLDNIIVNDITVNTAAVPEPASAVALGIGCLMLLVSRHRGRQTIVAYTHPGTNSTAGNSIC